MKILLQGFGCTNRNPQITSVSVFELCKICFSVIDSDIECFFANYNVKSIISKTIILRQVVTIFTRGGETYLWSVALKDKLLKTDQFTGGKTKSSLLRNSSY